MTIFKTSLDFNSVYSEVKCQFHKTQVYLQCVKVAVNVLNNKNNCHKCYDIYISMIIKICI